MLWVRLEGLEMEALSIVAVLIASTSLAMAGAAGALSMMLRVMSPATTARRR
jgi:hypothetical protein